MAHRILWAVAVVLAAIALVAGCFAPSKPLVVIGAGDSQPESAGRGGPPPTGEVKAMDKTALENEVIRLAAENDDLRKEIDKLKRENKVMKGERDRARDEVEELQDKLNKARSR
jgi:hypothetical protein